MSEEEQRNRMRAMRTMVAEFNVYRWAGRMLLDATRLRRQDRFTTRLSGDERASAARAMKDILARASRPMLRDLAARRTLLVLDFDGTLAPIVESRHHARLPVATVRLLREVAEGWPCAILSGRSRADVTARLAGVPMRAVLGNRGAEDRPALPGAAGWRRRVRTWRRSLEARSPGSAASRSRTRGSRSQSTSGARPPGEGWPWRSTGSRGPT